MKAFIYSGSKMLKHNKFNQQIHDYRDSFSRAYYNYSILQQKYSRSGTYFAIMM